MKELNSADVDLAISIQRIRYVQWERSITPRELHAVLTYFDIILNMATSSTSIVSAAKSKSAQAARHTLSLKEKYDVIQTVKKHPRMGARAFV